MRVKIKNCVAKLDKEDVAKVFKYKWRLVGCGYLAHNVFINKKQYNVYLHHFLIGQPLGKKVVDHINGDKLDNRKKNLRIVSQTVNNLNRHKSTRNTSGHIGVCYRPSSKRWLAAIEHHYNRVFIGSFPTKEEAVKARQDYERSI